MKGWVMNRYRTWRAASREVAEIVDAARPRVALIGAAMAALVGVPIVLRLLMFFPGATP